MPLGIGVWELVILMLVALLVFGPKRLPEMGRSLGRGMREFKDSLSSIDPRETDERPAERPVAERPVGLSPAREEPATAAPVREQDPA